MNRSTYFGRRNFLKAVGGMAAPFILPSHIWAAATPPSERITLGFIGIGKQGRGLLRNFLARDTQVVAVCDVDSNRREDSKKIVETHYAKESGSDFKGCQTTDKFEEILARKDIDAVVIATPDHWHGIIACAALNADKDVYCEKPLTQTVGEAASVVDAVRRNKRVFQTGSMQRSMKEFRVACELVRNGLIGKISRVECGFGGPPTPCDLPEEAMEPGLDWDRWLGPTPQRPYNSVLSPRGVHDHFPSWRKYREYGGGMVTDWGAHHLDIAQWGLGEDENGPVEMVPPSDWQTAQEGGQLIYASGIRVIHTSDKTKGVVFQGSDGTIQVNRGKVKFDIKGETRAKFLGREDTPSLAAQLARVEKELLADAKVQLYRSENHLEDFLECVRSRKQPITRVEIGARSAVCCHLLNFGYAYGEHIRWDAANLRFAKGSGNASWLVRPNRGKWKV